jgi:hypothetical protein
MKKFWTRRLASVDVHISQPIVRAEINDYELSLDCRLPRCIAYKVTNVVETRPFRDAFRAVIFVKRVWYEIKYGRTSFM